MTQLTKQARETIKAHGITIKSYIRHHSGSDTWNGDVCGCFDDRCANGYHHIGTDDCGCLPAILNMMLGMRP